MKKFRKTAVWVALILILTFGLMGCGGQQPAPQQPAPAQDKMKVAFIYIGPTGDFGFSYSHDQGRKYLEQQLDYVQTTAVESVPEGPDVARVLTELAEKGNKVIFATSFGYMDDVINVAQKYPNVVFMHCSGYKTAANAGTYFGRIYQGRYLSGIVAGKMTKSNVIGYVAAFPIPEVVRGINAFTLGVRSVNPNAVVKVTWTNDWVDSAKAKDAAKSLLEQKADVIAQHQDSPGPIQAAEEKGVYSVGYHSDMSQFAPKGYLTAPVWNWGPYYVKTVKAVKEGTWKNEQYWGSMSENIVNIGPYGPAVPEDVKKLVDAKKQEIVSGQWDVFTGPIKDQKGQVKVQAGQKMTDPEMLSFDWFVQGVEGTIPKN